MKLKVLFFAGLREQLGRASEEIEVPGELATIAGLRSHLRSRGGPYAAVFAEKSPVRAALNQDMAGPAARLKSGDEVAFFPPVTGG